MISVIIPTYNYVKYLFYAFQSVAYETRPLQIVIVNDGSTDATDKVVNYICIPYNYPEVRIKYIKLDRNHGVSYARNKGLEACTGDYITFLDADDMRTPGSIELQKKYLDEHPEVDVVWGKAFELRGDDSYKDAICKIKMLRHHPSQVNPQTVMYRRRVFEKYGGWYEGLTSGEDKEMSMRLGIHPESPFNFVKAKKLKSFMAFYRKHPFEKHKLRKKDSEWSKSTKRIQKQRIKQLKKEGITKENTPFPI